MRKRKATMVRGCKIITERPGIIESFIQPTKLKKQVTPAQPTSRIKFTPAGKTSVGTTLWKATIQRPGLAAPVIAAKAGPQTVKNEVKSPASE